MKPDSHSEKYAGVSDKFSISSGACSLTFGMPKFSRPKSRPAVRTARRGPTMVAERSHADEEDGVAEVREQAK